MAVVQISKIQVRRGKKNQGSGMPQLASGEIAWAVDTQELYIGNGAVSEGAPYVGNTKILTEHDSILELLTVYRYKFDLDIAESSIDATVRRSLQSRLDDGRVNAANFGVQNLTPAIDQTELIQAAVDALFATAEPTDRTMLEFNPGEYLITGTITLPSNVQISGSGKDVTTFKFTSSGAAFVTAGGSGKINLENFTVKITQDNSTCLTINGSKESRFKNLKFISDDGSPIAEGLSTLSTQNRVGIKLIGNTSINSNYYNGLDFKKLTFAVLADSDASFNTFENCSLEYLSTGFSFGLNSVNGASYNTVVNSTFDVIASHGIVVHNGSNNASRGNKFLNVGNDFSSINKTSIIKFFTVGNSSVQDVFQRSSNLETTYTQPYVQEIEGPTTRTDSQSTEVSLVTTSNIFPAFRLPVGESTYYEVKYVIKSTSYVRTGTMSVSVDRRVNDSDLSAGVRLVDDYDFVGSNLLNDTVVFSATVESNIDSAVTTKNVRISYVNSGAPVTLTYTYTVLS
jgi:hypothetical protein